MNQENAILGQEKISKLLLKFSVPCVTGLLISALYNIVDQIFIGNSELGYLGNAATGVSFLVICIANAFAWCVGDGAASYLSICAGRKDSDSAHKCVGTGITATLIISIIPILFTAERNEQHDSCRWRSRLCDDCHAYRCCNKYYTRSCFYFRVKMGNSRCCVGDRNRSGCVFHGMYVLFFQT